VCGARCAAWGSDPAREDTVTFLITFGYLCDGESGSVTADGGTIKKIEGWRFTQHDVTGPAKGSVKAEQL
jgi:hypothetical protein